MSFPVQKAGGQNNTNSPYSQYGIGELQHRGFGYTQAMGGTGIGVGSNEYLNILNPASYSQIDSGSFHFDIGTHIQYSQIQTHSQKENYTNGNLSYMAIGMPVIKRWSLGIAVLPVSNVGYEISSQKTIEGTSVSYQLLEKGSGGLSQFCLVNSLELFPFLSVGVSAGYTFGTLNVSDDFYIGQDETLVTTEEQAAYHGWNMEFGIQLSRTFASGTVLRLGCIYRPQYSLYGTSSYQVQTLSDSLIREKPLHSMLVPYAMGGGLSLTINRKLMWALDYSRTFWSATSESYTDNTVVSSGVDWIPDRESYQIYMKQVSYRIGARYESGYLVLRGSPIRKYVGTLGAGLPIRNFKNRINLTLEFGRQGTLKNSLAEEKYFRLILNVNLQDIWFRKYKYD